MTAILSSPSQATARRWPFVATLALSLALNLFFIGGAVWLHLHMPPPPMGMADRLQAIAGQLDLQPQQRQAFERYYRTMRARINLMHEEVEPVIADAWTEVGKPQADEMQVMRLFDTAAEKRRSFQREATTQTLAFLATLTPEQRARFVQIARERHDAWAKQVDHGVTP